MNDTVAGINENNLSALSLEVLDRADRISEIFQKLDNCMEKLEGEYQGSPNTQIQERYSQIRSQYPVAKENICGYSIDFMNLIEKMRENDKYLAQLFENAAENLKNTTNRELIQKEGEN